MHTAQSTVLERGLVYHDLSCEVSPPVVVTIYVELSIAFMDTASVGMIGKYRMIDPTIKVW